MKDKVLKTIKEKNLIEKGDTILVAVSGGPDSIALLHVLNAIKETYNLRLYACHLNHMLRGDAADGDADYVRDICQHLSIECFIEKKDINQLTKELKMSFEEAAREARYDMFYRLAGRVGADKIAIAQNMNDQAETILMRLFRGSGLEGLGAIKFKRDQIIRPILGIDRATIEHYCHINHLRPRVDHTNFQTDYTRNKIRLDLLPMIKETFNDQIIERLYETTMLLQDDLDYISGHVEDLYKTFKDHKLPLKELDVHPAILSRLIRRLFLDFGCLKNITVKNIRDITQLIHKGTHGKYLQYNQLKFEINYGELWIYTISDPINEEIQLSDQVTFQDYEFFLNDLYDAISIDESKVQGPLTIRTRKAGDKFYPLGMQGGKKLKDFFIDLKIPSKLRDEIPLICDSDSIIWVVGYRMSEKYKISNKTKNVIQISYRKRCE